MFYPLQQHMGKKRSKMYIRLGNFTSYISKQVVHLFTKVIATNTSNYSSVEHFHSHTTWLVIRFPAKTFLFKRMEMENEETGHSLYLAGAFRNRYFLWSLNKCYGHITLTDTRHITECFHWTWVYASISSNPSSLTCGTHSSVVKSQTLASEFRVRSPVPAPYWLQIRKAGK